MNGLILRSLAFGFAISSIYTGVKTDNETHFTEFLICMCSFGIMVHLYHIIELLKNKKTTINIKIQEKENSEYGLKEFIQDGVRGNEVYNETNKK